MNNVDAPVEIPSDQNPDYDSFIDSLPPSLRLKVVQAHAEGEEAPQGQGETPAETAPGAPASGLTGFRRGLVLVLLVCVLTALRALVLVGDLAAKCVGPIRKELDKL